MLHTPEKNHPLESTPPTSFTQCALRPQPPPPLRQPDETALTSMKPDEKFGIKSKSFEEYHGDFSI